MKKLAFWIGVATASMGSLAAAPSSWAAAAPADTTLTNIDEAVKVAHAKHLPVFLDFGAAWCHSCFAMADHVLSGPEWNAAQARFVLVKSDADSDNGSAWMTKLKVPSLPTYVVLNEDGSERARIVGEVSRAEFYQTLDSILSGQGSPEQRKARAMKGSMPDIAAVIDGYVDLFQDKEGMAWYQQLPASVRSKIPADPKAGASVAILQERSLQLQMDGQAHPQSTATQALAAACVKQAQTTLKYDLGLRRFAAVAGLATCAEYYPLAKRRSLIDAQRPSLDKLLSERVFGRDADKVDLLSVVSSFEWINQVTQQPERTKAVQDQAIASARKQLSDGHGGLVVTRNRSVAENLQIILDHAGYKAERLALLKQLAAAYPNEYYYLAEYGSALVAAGQPAQALPYLDKAATLVQPSGALSVARPRTQALMKLHRVAEAQAVVAAIVKANPNPAPGPQTYELDELKGLLNPPANASAPSAH